MANRTFLLNAYADPPQVLELGNDPPLLDAEWMLYDGVPCWLLRRLDGDTGDNTTVILLPQERAEEIVDLYERFVAPVM